MFSALAERFVSLSEQEDRLDRIGDEPEKLRRSEERPTRRSPAAPRRSAPRPTSEVEGAEVLYESL
jgi:hypothetical protein